MFRKGKTHIRAKFHRIDLVICSHSREGKTLSYSRIDTLSQNYPQNIFSESAIFLQYYCYIFNAVKLDYEHLVVLVNNLRGLSLPIHSVNIPYLFGYKTGFSLL